jgi:hypothetical protein
MRNGTSSLLYVALSFIILTTSVHAQHSLPEFTLPSPPKGVVAPPLDKLKIRSGVQSPHPSVVDKSPAEFASQSAAGSTILLWTGSDNGYTFQMVGQDPSVPHSNQVTNIKAQLIPVQITFYGNQTVVFDPTKKDICSPSGSPLTLVQRSPLFNNVSLPIAPLGGASSAALGTAQQFTSLFQRANFFKFTQPTGVNPRYGVTLTLTTLPVVKINTYYYSNPLPRKCAPVGQVYKDTLDYAIVHGIIPQLASFGVGPTTLPIFLLNNVVMPDASCCFIFFGYHGSFISGTCALQTYIVANYDTSGLYPDAPDISTLSHEIAEWMNDPTVLNPTPPWKNAGGGCQPNLEVGDALEGQQLFPIYMPNFTYHVQDLTFKSWFYGDTPSVGVNGWYSLFGTFRSAALPCP